MEVFPVEYFCPVAYAGSTCDITPNTYSIHHYHASWKEKSRAMRFDEEVMEPLLGAKFYYRYYRPFRRALGARRKNGAPEPSRKRLCSGPLAFCLPRRGALALSGTVVLY